MKSNILFPLISLILIVFFSCNFTNDQFNDKNLKLWYQSPAKKWSEAFPLGNGRLAAMCYGGTKTERFQINEESLWAGCQVNPVADNFFENLKEFQKLVLAGEYAKAHDFGVAKLTATPTSFRSFEPFGDLIIEFDNDNPIQNYKRELDMATGLCKVEYKNGETEVTQESFISAVDDVLCIRLSVAGNEKLNCNVGLQRFKDANVTVVSDDRINLDGQVIDIEAPDGYDDNPGGSGPGGKHMRFSGRLVVKTPEGTIKSAGNRLRIESAKEITLLFHSCNRL